MAAILNSAILDSDILHKNNLHLIHSDSTWWWQPSCILPSWILTPCFLLSDSLTKLVTHYLHSELSLTLIPPHHLHKKLHSFFLTQLDDGSHPWFLPSWHSTILIFPLQTHSHLSRLVPTICTKKNFTHSFWLNLMMAAILNSAIQTPCFLLRFTQKHSFHSDSDSN